MDIHFIHRDDYYLSSMQIDFMLDFMERSQFFPAGERSPVVYTGFWMVILVDEPAGRFAIEADTVRVNIEGSTAIFIPPYTPVTFIRTPGLHKWHAFSCFIPLDKSFPSGVTVFPWDKTKSVERFSQLADILRGLGNISKTQSLIGRTTQSQPLAARAKLYLDQHFTEEIHVSDLVRDIHQPHSTIATAFSRRYGVSMIGYRNLLRSFDGLRRISQGEKVVEAAAKVGYHDYSRFYRNFSAALSCAPSDFSRRGFSRCQHDLALNEVRKTQAS